MPERLLCERAAAASSCQLVKFDADEAADCLQAVDASACGDDLDRAVNDPSSACQNVFVGQLGLGASCPSDEVCGPGLFCSFYSEDGARRATGTCMAKSGPGDHCGPFECGYPYQCDPLSLTCQLLQGPLGAACGVSDTGLSTTCAHGRCDITYVDPDHRFTEGTCQAPNPRGTSCVVDRDCDDSSYCAAPPGSQQGLCAQRVAVGEACAAARECVPFASCDAVSGTCETYGEIGDSCSTAPCLQGYCASGPGVCAALLGQGGDCSAGLPCAPGLACSGPARELRVCTPLCTD